jgi:predicted HTH domain antitoxin
LADPRVLGTGAFVEQMLRAGDARLRAQRGWSQRLQEAQKWIARQSRRAGITPEEVRRGGRRQPVATVRGQLAVQLVTELGLSLAEAARHLGISTSGVAKILSRRGKA